MKRFFKFSYKITSSRIKLWSETGRPVKYISSKFERAPPI